MSLRQLGRLTGISYSALSLYENGLRHPSLEAQKAIAKELRISREYLFPSNGRAA